MPCYDEHTLLFGTICTLTAKDTLQVTELVTCEHLGCEARLVAAGSWMRNVKFTINLCAT